MPGQGCVVVITQRFDPTADMVVEELNRRAADVFRFDTADFPLRLSVAAELTDTQEEWIGSAQNGRRTLNLGEVAGIYYRRPTSFKFHDELSVEERRWSAIQARMGLGGLLATCEPWLNHPHRIGFAEYKPVQLVRAKRAGLRVPRTLLTNDPAAAERFLRKVGRAIYKPLGGIGLIDTDGRGQLFASPIAAEQVVANASIEATMHLFQEWVPKQYEVRLTVVDEQLHAARIDASTPAGHADWRADYGGLTYSRIDPPGHVRSGVSALMKSFSLRFAALDFVVSPNADWWFLECNPNGQWAWIEEETQMPIAAAIADALTRGTRA